MLELQNIDNKYKFYVQWALETCDNFSLVYLKDGTKTNYDSLNDIDYITESLFVSEKSILYNIATGTYFDSAKLVFYKCEKKAKTLLYKANSFFDWNGTTLPEELCFYKDGLPWLCCITHEGIIVLQNYSRKDLNFLKKNEITFNGI